MRNQVKTKKYIHFTTDLIGSLYIFHILMSNIYIRTTYIYVIYMYNIYMKIYICICKMYLIYISIHIYLYIFIYIYIYIYICICMYIHIYICYHENNVPSRLSPQWLRGNLCTWARDDCFCEIWALCVSWITYDHLYV